MYLSIYNHPEIDRIWGMQGNIMVLSKIIFFLLQDGCMYLPPCQPRPRPPESWASDSSKFLRSPGLWACGFSLLGGPRLGMRRTHIDTVYIHIYIYVCLHTYMCIYMSIDIHISIYIHISFDMYVSADPWVACWTLARFNLPLSPSCH